MDIVERLRTPLGSSDSNFNYAYYNRMCCEAADEIERLREALREIAAPSKVFAKGNDMADVLVLLLTSHRKTALKALGEKE